MNDIKKGILGEFILDIKGGGTPSRDIKEYWGGEIPWASVKDLTCTQPQFTEENITHKGLKSSASRLIPKGIPVMATRMAVGRTAVFKTDVAINQDLKAIFPNPKLLDKDYLFHTLVANEKNLYSKGIGSTVKGIRVEDLEKLPIVLPPLPEQRRIAEVLSGIDQSLLKIKNYLEKLYLIKEQVVLNLLQVEPSNKTLEDFGFNVLDGDRGKAYPRESDLKQTGDCLFLSARNVTIKGFNFSENQFISKKRDEEMRKGRLEKGDLVITTRGSLGHIAHFNDYVPFKKLRINSGMAIIRSVNSRDLLKENFLKELLFSRIIQDQIKDLAFGTAQNQLTLSILRKIKIPVLGSKRMRYVVNFSNTFSKFISSYELYFEKLKLLNQGIACELLSGQKRVVI